VQQSILCEYIEWIAARRMKKVNLPTPYTVKSNPLPWTEKWISGAEVQVAPQETEISSYIIGDIKRDIDDDTFKGLSL
jgi:ribonucleoside-diphosphate reductase beta chain